VATTKFIHTADWQLGKPFRRFPQEVSAALGEARLDVIDRLTEVAASRRESDAAEEALQDLLGFERGNNRGSDPETRGPLGLLWVAQASALGVESPNRLVRDTVRGVLEAEVGAVTGGAALRRDPRKGRGRLRRAAHVDRSFTRRPVRRRGADR